MTAPTNSQKLWVEKVSLRYQAPTRPVPNKDQVDVHVTGFEQRESMLQAEGFCDYFIALSQNVDPNIDVRFKATLIDGTQFICRWDRTVNLWNLKKPGEENVSTHKEIKDAFNIGNIEKITIRIRSSSADQVAIASLDRAKAGIEFRARGMGLEPLGKVFGTHTAVS
jgi:hypothetical protein